MAGCSVGGDVDPPGDLNQLGHPRNAGDHRIVPFLEIYSRPAQQRRGAASCFNKSSGKLFGKPIGTIASANHSAEHADHVENLGDAALVESVNCDAPADQRGDDIGLKIGKAQDQIGLLSAVPVRATRVEPSEPPVVPVRPQPNQKIPGSHLGRIRTWLRYGMTMAQVAEVYRVMTQDIERVLQKT